MLFTFGAVLLSTVAQQPAMPGFHVQHGNACGPRCGCNGDGCKDMKGFAHFAGTKATLAECEATCTAAPKGACNIFVYSLGSRHCWCAPLLALAPEPKAVTLLLLRFFQVAAGRRMVARLGAWDRLGVPAGHGCLHRGLWHV